MNNTSGSGGRLFLLDAYALIFRAYYAFINRHMYNSKGLNTSAVFGFTIALDEILKKESPSHIAVVFDPPGPTFRHEKYPLYKANRDETPEDIKKSIPIIKELLGAFKIPVIEVAGYEADDVIGTISKSAEKSGFSVFMMTPDKDYTQLVSENIKLYKPRKGSGQAEIMGVAEVLAQYEITSPLQVIDILALSGDASDNVPGAPGIGPKTAIKLVKQFGSVDSVIENADKLTGKMKDSIIGNSDTIRLSRDLVTISLDVPVDFDEESLKRKDPDFVRLGELFAELEFRNLASRIMDSTREVPRQKIENDEQGSLFPSKEEGGEPEEKPDTIQTRKHSYHLLEDGKDLNRLIREIKQKGRFCFDTETTGIDPLEAALVGISISLAEHEAWYLPFPARGAARTRFITQLEEVFSDKNIGKTGQNIKYDIKVLSNYGITVKGEVFDTMIAHYLLHPEAPHNLDFLSEKYLRYRPVPIENLIGEKGKNQATMDQVPVEKVSDYACEDADLTWQLARILADELKKEGLGDLAIKVEFPLIPVLSDMEIAGFVIDVASLEQYGKVLTDDLIRIEEEIFRQARERFNVSSPKQLGIILFEKLKISEQARKTKSRQYSTSEDVLSRLAGQHPIVPLVLEFRTLKKLMSTYVAALPKMIRPSTGKIHTSFNQAVAATGRLSSNNPNLQNIPIREERGREIRKAFVPEPGHILVSADYSQIELRLMAHMSLDEHLIAAFNNHEDIHTATAAKVFNLPQNQVTREMRTRAKTANFGIIYGISAFGLSQRLNIGRTEAKELIEGYFRSYPGVRQYMDESISRAREKGYVETILGRRRFLPDIHSRNAVVRGFAERNAINAPIQGSAADIIKIAMINIHKQLNINNMASKMILQVHDELIFDVVPDEEDGLKKMVRGEMERAMELRVPLEVDIGSGHNWLEAH